MSAKETRPVINGIDTSKPAPPELLYTCSRKRLRAGLGVLTLRTIAWEEAARQPWGVYASQESGRGNKGYYSLSDCFTTPKDAAFYGLALLRREEASEKARRAVVDQRLAIARAVLQQTAEQ